MMCTQKLNYNRVSFLDGDIVEPLPLRNFKSITNYLAQNFSRIIFWVVSSFGRSF